MLEVVLHKIRRGASSGMETMTMLFWNGRAFVPLDRAERYSPKEAEKIIDSVRVTVRKDEGVIMQILPPKD